MVAQEPFLEQARIALQQRLAEFPHVRRRRDRLQPHQLLDGGLEMRIGIGIIDDFASVGLPRSSIGRTPASTPAPAPRHAYAAAFEQCAHAQARTHVFQARRRIHDDAARVPFRACASSYGSPHPPSALQRQAGVADGMACPLEPGVLAIEGVGGGAHAGSGGRCIE